MALGKASEIPIDGQTRVKPSGGDLRSSSGGLPGGGGFKRKQVNLRIVSLKARIVVQQTTQQNYIFIKQHITAGELSLNWIDGNARVLTSHERF